MMQTTRLRRLDRLLRRGEPTEAPELIFHWDESDRAGDRHTCYSKESRVTAAGDPVRNWDWAAPKTEPSL
jgi:hypothetical protein